MRCGEKGRYVFRTVVKNIYWNMYGVSIINPVLPATVRSILFICKGNICRSPFAEQIARKQVNNLNAIEFSSAGIYVNEPKSPPQEAIISSQSFGVALCDHKSKQVNYDLMESHDMIVAMETWQYRYLKKIFIEFENKIFLLPLFCRNDINDRGAYYKYNIQDPFGRRIEDFKECFNIIESCVAVLFNKIGILQNMHRDAK